MIQFASRPVESSQLGHTTFSYNHVHPKPIIARTNAADRRRDRYVDAAPIEDGWMVRKYGGTSIGKFADEIVRDIIMTHVRQTRRLAIVCSARSSTTKRKGTTTLLMQAADNVLNSDSHEFRDLVEAVRVDHIEAGKAIIHLDRHSEYYIRYINRVNTECKTLLQVLEAARVLRAVTAQTEDMIISTGEKLSCLFMVALLQSHGIAAEFIDLCDIATNTSKIMNDSFCQSIGKAIKTRISTLRTGTIPVITGFFGPCPGGMLKEIGRGYTDLCAAITAVGLGARELQIWKEVDGIFTADPNKVPAARQLLEISPSEAAELTFFGSEVINPFTMNQLIGAKIPMRVKNVLNPEGTGTLISAEGSPIVRATPKTLLSTSGAIEKTADLGVKGPTAVTVKHDIIVLNIHSHRSTRAHGFLMSIFKILDQHHLCVDLISSSEVHISMALHSDHTSSSDDNDSSSALQDAISDLRQWGEIDVKSDMAIISLVGKQLRTMFGISGRFFSILGDNGINIEMISQGASEINISCVIEEKDADRALKVVHENLFSI